MCLWSHVILVPDINYLDKYISLYYLFIQFKREATTGELEKKNSSITNFSLIWNKIWTTISGTFYIFHSSTRWTFYIFHSSTGWWLSNNVLVYRRNDRGKGQREWGRKSGLRNSHFPYEIWLAHNYFTPVSVV